MKKYLVLFLTLLLSSVSLADKVTEQEALQKAQQFMPDKHFKETASSACARSGKSADPKMKSSILILYICGNNKN